MPGKKTHPEKPHFDLNPLEGIHHTMQMMEKHGLSHIEVALVLFGGWGLGLAASATIAYGLVSGRSTILSIGLLAQVISLVGPWAYLGARIFFKRGKKK